MSNGTAVPSNASVRSESPEPTVEETKPQAKLEKGQRTRVVLFALFAAGAVAGIGHFINRLGIESTDDAQLDANVVTIPARVAGVVSKVSFEDNQDVKAGDVLAEIDAAPLQAKLTQAEAALRAAQANAAAADAEVKLAEANARGNKSAAEASLQSATVGASVTRKQIAEAEAAAAAAQAALHQATTDRDRSKALFESGSMAQAAYDRSEIDYETAKAKYDQAQAHVASLQSSVSQAQSKIGEASAKVTQVKDVDAVIARAQARADAAHADVELAKAARDLAALDVSYTRITAPRDGIVSKRKINAGQAVALGQSVVELVPDKDIWVTANFKETQIEDMHVGQHVEIAVDAFSSVTLSGTVDSISPATGSRFTLLPPDNATGNFTKVVQRVPVRVRIDSWPEGVTLRPGLSVDVSVDTRS